MNSAGPAVHPRRADDAHAAGARADAPRPAVRAQPAAQEDVAVIVLADVDVGSRLWGYARFLGGRFQLPRAPGLRFSRSLGSGHEGGFGLRPSLSRQGLFCIFRDEASADRFVGSDFVEGYRDRCRELLVAKLGAYSSRGSWAGQRLAVGAVVPSHGPVAALTRASIRPSRAAAFWRKAPPAERSLEAARGCLLAVGLGEAPILRQATFSLWESVAAMDDYARSGAHLEAIRAAHAGGYFSESMFVRFAPYDVRGTWKGRTFG